MKKIVVNTIKAFFMEHKTANMTTTSFEVGESSFDVQIKTSLSIEEKTAFISRVLSGCFDTAGNYRPEYVTPMIQATILQVCTNVPVITLKGEISDDGGSVMDIGAMSDLYAAMDLDHFSDVNYRVMKLELNELTNAAIEWKKSYVLAKLNNAVSDALRNWIESFEKVKESDLKELMQYAKKLSNATDNLDEGGILKGLIALKDNK